MAVIRYIVNDIDKAIPFYQALGFEMEERWGPPFVMMKLGDLTLWLSGPGSSAAQTLSDGSVPSPGGWNRLVIQVEDIIASMNELLRFGAKFRSEPVYGPGGAQVLVDDPFGNPIELFEPA